MDVSQSLRAISRHYCVDEQRCVKGLLPLIRLAPASLEEISVTAGAWVERLLVLPAASPIQALLNEYALDTEEGQALLVLAESLLRIPDSTVANALISDQLKRGDWQGLGEHSASFFVKASSLLLTWSGHWLGGDEAMPALLKKYSAPVVHRAMMQMIRVLAGQFVFADNIQAAVKKARTQTIAQQSYSFDMLGEAAVCEEQAAAFHQAYLQAIAMAGASLGEAAHISIKLSALSPRFEILQADAVIPALVKQLDSLLSAAAEQGVAITLDAEEAYRLEILLAVFARSFRRWGQRFAGRLGVAVQAYSTRALPVLSFLDELAQAQKASIAVRLVKGAYWDTEIKLAQMQGLEHFPVFTQKCHTDISYLACAHQLLTTHGWLQPQFATHNPVTISHILAIATAGDTFEFQRLHGMGEALYQGVLEDYPERQCRVYSPVGNYQSLLPYLVRRVLENGSNNSFVRRLAHQQGERDTLCRHPLTEYFGVESAPQVIRLPRQLFGEERVNSPTINLASFEERIQLHGALQAVWDQSYELKPVVAFTPDLSSRVEVSQPASGNPCGSYLETTETTASKALAVADQAFIDWKSTTANARADHLLVFAGQLVQHRTELLALLMSEAGKTLEDALSEWREAFDFCQYYAARCRQWFSAPVTLPGPDGEHNALHWEGRGVFLCISPWNFPLAIFVGQVSAALMAGNVVLAKPAEATSLIACRVVSMMHKAGFPQAVVQCLPGNGQRIGGYLLADERVAGVAFTGALATAQTINRQLAERPGALVPLIAETGGQNAMVVDSSALPEQVVRDVMHSAFLCAGQRCSALRVLFLQKEIYDSTLALLIKAVATLNIGNPKEFKTDIGPVINTQAAGQLHVYIDHCQRQGRVIFAAPLPEGMDTERYVTPHIIQLDNMRNLQQEYFGPILHVRCFEYSQLDAVMDEINRSGFGLTAGVHSRDQALCQRLAAGLAVGNVYINREMTGAVVGVQPFGGRGLSGTGPKAGGPHYLQRFATEKTISNNVAAIGGSVSLLVDKPSH